MWKMGEGGMIKLVEITVLLKGIVGLGMLEIAKH